MDTAAIHARLRERLGEKIGELEQELGGPCARVSADAIVDACRFAKEDEELGFDCLTNQSGVDYKDKGVIQVVYHLFSYRHKHSFVLKVDLPRDDPKVPTVEGVWKTANWLEREIYDLLGVVFEGHSDLRRILMPEDWQGYPLRKDFVEPQEYHGISTKRESLI